MSTSTLLSFSLLFVFCYSAMGVPPTGEYLTTREKLPQYSDRECGGTLENLWLDIVFVVDNSVGMKTTGLTDVVANMLTVLGGVQLGHNAQNPMTTRVGIVTYNKEATIVANLDTFSSYDDFINRAFSTLSSVSSYTESYLANGLAAAEHVFDNGKRNDRSIYKKVVIVYASTYNENGGDPVAAAQRLKTDEVAIITVAYGQNNEGALLKKLSNIASGNMYFDNKNAALSSDVQNALSQVNCFCPIGWTHYKQSFTDNDSKKYGVCIKTIAIPANWAAAKLACAKQWESAHLVNEYTQHKHDFVLSDVKNITASSSSYQYHIGLSSHHNDWYWEQPFNSVSRPLSPNSLTLWNPGYPSDMTRTAVMNNVYSGSRTGWQNIDQNKESSYYVCEVKSCDTDNFCSVINKKLI